MELAFGDHQSEPKVIEFGKLPKGSGGLRLVFGHHSNAKRNRLYWRQKHHQFGRICNSPTLSIRICNSETTNKDKKIIG